MDWPKGLIAFVEAELVQRIAGGEAEAVAELYDRSSPLLFGLASRIVNDSTEAEDVLQEVYVRVWEQASHYDSALGSPMSWLITITRNLAIERVRSRQRKSRVAAESVLRANPGSPEPHPEAALIGHDTALLIRSALARLSAEQRVAIEMAFFNGMTQQEIADELNEPLGTIKARIRRGMLVLREELKTRL